MKNLLFSLLIGAIFLISCQDKKESISKPEVEDAKIPKIKLKDLIGNTYEFDYSKYVYHIKIESDSTVFWKLIKGDFEGASEGTDKYIYSQLDDNMHFISWTEASGLGLYNILDFETNKLTTHAIENGVMFINPGRFKKVK